MIKYLTEEQLRSNLKLGKSVEQWLTYEKRDDYTVLKWLRIDNEKSLQFSVSYFESFDEGDENFLDIYEFSLLDPDELFGVINTFDSVEEVLSFVEVKYSALINRFVPAGGIQDEYQRYVNSLH
ncbi:MAG: hypothetical protein AAGC65_22180 [Mucilaginibacter sp.]|uniref:hypothetical protein n=1 Tax=Mucilaginibacter sp. TaxID=1882438 RepID=UPI0031A59690